MAARKQFSENVPVDETLMKLLEATKDHKITEDELREQMISFAFGNAPNSEFITKDSVRTAFHSLRLTSE